MNEMIFLGLSNGETVFLVVSGSRAADFTAESDFTCRRQISPVLRMDFTAEGKVRAHRISLAPAPWSLSPFYYNFLFLMYDVSMYSLDFIYYLYYNVKCNYI